ncbi:MAG: hypothetical protein HC835_11170 [Oscillatoriales cyanobacterium RM2_1_1]|nr:hypothetical protein [Oscillatoriales cyanobacterium SM2_3_0]NJO46135.1 hypothetical protein [Oscillatoriales cyanobacterium RM2_1_1]
MDFTEYLAKIEKAALARNFGDVLCLLRYIPNDCQERAILHLSTRFEWFHDDVNSYWEKNQTNVSANYLQVLSIGVRLDQLS